MRKIAECKKKAEAIRLYKEHLDAFLHKLKHEKWVWLRSYEWYSEAGISPLCVVANGDCARCITWPFPHKCEHTFNREVNHLETRKDMALLVEQLKVALDEWAADAAERMKHV